MRIGSSWMVCGSLLVAGCGAGEGGAVPADGDAATAESGADALDSSVDAPDETDEGIPDAAEELATADAPVGGGSLEKRSYAGPEGTRDYLLYLPAAYGGSPMPLVVALHGCNESASHFAYVSRLHQFADSAGFLVAWPEQTWTANSMMCWNWFLSAHQQRASGEAAIVAGIAKALMQELAVDPGRVHAVGISAGGAMALVVGTVFPDLFASVASVEGCPFQGVPCVGSASTLSGETLAGLAYSAMGTHARALPVFVVQGDIDLNVPPPNGELIVQQYLGVADRADDGLPNLSVDRQPAKSTGGSVPGGHSYEIDTYEDAAGQVLVERWLIHGMGHAWPGGPSAMAYSDPAGPDVSVDVVRFLQEHPMP